MEQFRITNLDNGITIGDKTYPPNYYIIVDKEGNDIQLKLAGNEIDISTRWQNFEDSAGNPYASKAEVIAALALNNMDIVPSEADLQEIIALLESSLGGNGTEFIFGTGAITGKQYKYLVVNDPNGATFTTLKGSVTANLLAALPAGLGITTNNIAKGMIIKGFNGELITEVTLATGSVVGVKS